MMLLSQISSPLYLYKHVYKPNIDKSRSWKFITSCCFRGLIASFLLLIWIAQCRMIFLRHLYNDVVYHIYFRRCICTNMSISRSYELLGLKQYRSEFVVERVTKSRFSGLFEYCIAFLFIWKHWQKNLAVWPHSCLGWNCIYVILLLSVWPRVRLGVLKYCIALE